MARTVVYYDRGRWRVRVIDRATGRRSTTSYATEQEARRAAARLVREYERPVGKPLPEAIADYRLHLAEGGVTGEHPNKPRTIETTIGRLNSVLAGIGTITGDLKAAEVEAAWQSFTSRPGPVSGKPPSVDTRANTLKQIRTFFRWCIEKGWMSADPLAAVKVVGKRRRGKRQLAGVDESRRFLGKALEMGANGDVGAVAAATALLMGMRASEVAERTVGSLDARGTVLVVTDAKTEAGNRRLMVPVVLQPLLAELAEGRERGERLFGAAANRHWVLRAVRRICKTAGVTAVTPHGLRGTHATLSRAAGVSGLVLAASMGHESPSTTERHYVAPGAAANADASAFLAALN